MPETKLGVISGFGVGPDKSVRPISINLDSISPLIPAAVYSLEEGMTGYYLSYKFDKFEDDTLLFGNIDKTVARVINTYRSRDKSLGAMFTGTKGGGKSKTIRRIGNTLLNELNVPVVIVNKPINNDAIVSFISSLSPAVILLDEFAKQQRAEGDGDHPAVLQLFDGVVPNKNLYLVTENNSYHLNDFLINRPGRIFYHYTFDKLGEDEIKEICEHYKIPEDKTAQLVEIGSTSSTFTYDSAFAFIEEMLRYPDDTPREIAKILNVETKEPTYTITPQRVVVDEKFDAVILDEKMYSVGFQSYSDRFTVDLAIKTSSKTEMKTISNFLRNKGWSLKTDDKTLLITIENVTFPTGKCTILDENTVVYQNGVFKMKAKRELYTYKSQFSW